MFRCVSLYVFFLLFTQSVWSKSIDAQFSGFATLAATYSDSDELMLRTDLLNNFHNNLTIKSDSNIGLQVNVDIATKWDAVGQLVLQDRVKKGINSYVELAFVIVLIDIGH